MEIIRGFKVGKKLSHWESICEEWLLVVERYSRRTDGGDEAFGMGERANIGLLAGAAWRCGRIALEEFQNKKLHNGEEKNGRSDLWLCDEADKEEYVEAKFKWVSLNSKDVVGICDETLKKACEDAVDTRCGDKDTVGVGVAFIAFYTKEKSKDEMIEKIHSAIDDIKNKSKYDVISWCFPEKSRAYKYDNNNITPGIMMLARKVKELYLHN